MKRTLLIATAVCALAGAGFAVASMSALKTVNIRSTGFVPRTVTVPATGTVRWKNVDTINHQPVANSGAFACPTITPNRTCSKVMNTPGKYAYRDALHPTLRGSVHVTGPPPSISIASSIPIATFGDDIQLSGAISPAAVGDMVSVWKQPWGQMSFVKVADVLTTTNGSWAFSTSGDSSPQILTFYKATWKGHESATVQVAVSPRLTLTRSGGRFRARAQAAKSFQGNWVYVQRLTSFGQWVVVKRVTLNSESAKRFKLTTLRKGRNRLRLFMTTNQAGSGYFESKSPTLTFRRG
jgi:plastocyanin